MDYEYPTEDYGIMTVRFEEGKQRMDGERALIYSRTRKSTSDFARAARQQEVVMALRDKVLSLDIIPSLTPANVTRLIATVNRSIMTDLTPDEVLAFAKVGKDINEPDIHRLVIDNTMVNAYITYQGAEVLLPQWGTIMPLVSDTFDMELLPVAPMASLPPPLPSPTATRVWPTWTPTPQRPVRTATPDTFVTFTPTSGDLLTPTPSEQATPEAQGTPLPTPELLATPTVPQEEGADQGTDTDVGTSSEGSGDGWLSPVP